MNSLENFDIPILLQKILRLDKILQLYLEAKKDTDPSDPTFSFIEKMLHALSINYSINAEELNQIKKIPGPILFVANHPFGAIDGLILLMLMRKINPRCKLIANSIFVRIEEMKDVILPVEIMQKSPNKKLNLLYLKNILKELNENNTIGMFPAGEVAAYSSWKSKQATEKPWHPHLGKMALKTRATIIPIFFEGENSLLFQYIGLIFPKMQIALLAREILQAKKEVVFTIGEVIKFEDYHHLHSDEVSIFLQNKTYALKKCAL